MNRLSNASFVPLSVYIGFRLFVLTKRPSVQLFTILWMARELVGCRATRTVAVPFCSAPPHSAVPPYATPTRTARSMFEYVLDPTGKQLIHCLSTAYKPVINRCFVPAFPNRPCKKKNLQGQKGVGPLVSSQEQRALLVPLINRAPVESKFRTYHGQVGSGRTAGWRNGVEQDWVPTELCA